MHSSFSPRHRGPGIRRRLLSSYLLLLGLILALMGTGLILGLDWYYRSAITDVLSLRARSDQQFLMQLLQGVDLTVAGQDLTRELSAGLPARVQLFRADGRLVGDSSLPAAPGPAAPAATVLSEVSLALSDKAQQERLAHDDEARVLHLAVPILAADQSVFGALRYSTSLASVDRLRLRALGIVVLSSLAILLLAALIGLFLANSLVRPLAELTQIAEAIGSGNLGLRARVYLPDEVGRLALTLNHMAAALSELERLRSDFLRAVSHELKTPLAAIKAWAVTLQDDDVPPEDIRQGLVAVERSTDHLTRLVEDLITAARLQAGGQITLHPRRIDPVEATQAICQAMASRAREAGIHLHPPSKGPIPAIHVDPDRYAQIVVNLLENAIKFTPGGGQIHVGLAADRVVVRLIISDTGSGIDPEDLPRVTEPFFRGRRAKAIPGTGLGLAIVQDLVRLSGGDLIWESKVGEGTVVRLHFPLAGRDER